MIVDREREIEVFVPETYWQLHLVTEKNRELIEARHTTSRFTDQVTAKNARDHTTEPLVVTEVKEGTKTDRAPSPFDTTSFIVASARLGFSAANAMRIAEDLYMNGFISYPRTDNTVYPPTLDLNGILRAILPGGCREDVEWVMAHLRPVPTRGKKSSTDHPPIHPTAPATRAMLGDDHWKIYELVLRRFLATVSPDAEWQTMKVNLAAGTEPYTVTGGRLTTPGWRTVYPYSEAKEHILPAFVVGEHLPIKERKSRRERDAAPGTVYPEPPYPADGRTGPRHKKYPARGDRKTDLPEVCRGKSAPPDAGRTRSDRIARESCGYHYPPGNDPDPRVPYAADQGTDTSTR